MAENTGSEHFEDFKRCMLDDDRSPLEQIAAWEGMKLAWGKIEAVYRFRCWNKTLPFGQRSDVDPEEVTTEEEAVLESLMDPFLAKKRDIIRETADKMQSDLAVGAPEARGSKLLIRLVDCVEEAFDLGVERGKEIGKGP
jgi:hypothetical protein